MKIFNFKLLLQVSLLFTVLFVSACGDDDEEAGTSVNFLDQNVQGQIDGVSFSLGEGRADVINDELSIDFFDANEQIDDVCDFFGFGDEINVFFTVPNEVGLFPLNFDFTSGGQTVTFFNPDGNLNIFASDGAIEILTITDTQVTGRIDARAGDDAINGNFTLTICE